MTLPPLAERLRWTPARRRAMEVFAGAPDHRVRESNATRAAGRAPTVYWQTRAWLSGRCLIEAAPGRYALKGYYRLTPAGIEAARDLGMMAETGRGT